MQPPNSLLVRLTVEEPSLASLRDLDHYKYHYKLNIMNVTKTEHREKIALCFNIITLFILFR